MGRPGPDRKIFGQEAPSWLKRAIRVCLHEAARDGSTGQQLAYVQELVTATAHAPTPDGICRGCLPVDTRPWPCHEARHLLRQHRGEAGWRPHWDQHIEGTS